MRGRRFAFLKDLRRIATVLVLRRLPDLEGVPSAFKVVLGSAIAVLTSLRLARGFSFFLAPLLSLLINVSSVARVCRLIKEVMVVRGMSVLAQI